MFTAIELIGTTILVGCLISILAVIVEKWFIKIGFARGNTTGMVLAIFTLIFIKITLYPHVSWWLFGPTLFIGGPIAVNRGDLWTSMQKGCFWWKSEK
jgi:hypothetical protein